MKINKQRVQKILNSIQNINKKEISNKGGNIDFDKLKENSEIKRVVQELKNIGVTRDYLSEHFFIASKIIGFLFENKLQEVKKNG